MFVGHLLSDTAQFEVFISWYMSGDEPKFSLPTGRYHSQPVFYRHLKPNFHFSYGFTIFLWFTIYPGFFFQILLGLCFFKDIHQGKQWNQHWPDGKGKLAKGLKGRTASRLRRWSEANPRVSVLILRWGQLPSGDMRRVVMMMMMMVMVMMMMMMMMVDILY